jgi:hypothetical protein
MHIEACQQATDQVSICDKRDETYVLNEEKFQAIQA